MLGLPASQISPPIWAAAPAQRTLLLICSWGFSPGPGAEPQKQRTPPHQLSVCLQRRLRAAKLLGWTTVPVSAVDLDAVVRGEFAENTRRKDFTLSEAVAIKRAPARPTGLPRPPAWRGAR